MSTPGDVQYITKLEFRGSRLTGVTLTTLGAIRLKLLAPYYIPSRSTQSFSTHYSLASGPSTGTEGTQHAPTKVSYSMSTTGSTRLNLIKCLRSMGYLPFALWHSPLKAFCSNFPVPFSTGRSNPALIGDDPKSHCARVAHSPLVLRQ